MLRAFTQAIEQLGDPAIRRVLWLGLFVATLVFAALWFAMYALLTGTAVFQTGWLETFADVLGGLATLALTWVLFPSVVGIVVGLLLEGVAGAVERRHYPDLDKAHGVSMGEAIAITLRFLVIMVVLNLVILVFLLLPPVFPFVFYAVNGYLLGREYFELVASRRLGAAEVRKLRRARRGGLFVAGLGIALMLTVPVVNLLAPVVATAAMVHLFEGWRRGSA